MIDSTILQKLKAIVGAGNYLDSEGDVEPYIKPWRGPERGKTPLVVLPKTTAHVSQIVALCHQTGTALVPQGGNTGLVGGSIPDASGDQVVLSLTRMNQIRSIDPVGMVAVVEAGCILQQFHDHLAEKECMFPVSIASQGSCQMGGILSTNAGGINVLRYGTTRDQVLGLEVVLADGTIWNGLGQLRKDNTGYDLKQLFIGSEGTLGIITAACVKLYPHPKERHTAMLATSSMEQVIEVLHLMRSELGEFLSAFEVISAQCASVVQQHFPDLHRPFLEIPPYQLLLELETGSAVFPLREPLEKALESALEKGLITNAVIAESGQQRTQLWNSREWISEAARSLGKGIHFDLAVPIRDIPAYVKDIEAAIAFISKGITPLIFGHVGDGNLHVNLYAPTIDSHTDALKKTLYALTQRYQGSISAEHGVGVHRKKDLTSLKPAEALKMMRQLKQTLDPQGILNPGKVIDL